MNFLQIVQMLRRESVDSGTGPSTVVSQTGEAGRMVGWCADEYYELQQERSDWRWLHKYFTVNATVGVGAFSYTDCTDTVTTIAIDRFSRWYEREFKCYLSSDGVGSEYPLVWLEWNRFRRIYRYGTQNNSQPMHVSQDETMKFVLGPIPDATYVVSGGYERGPQILALDADTPEMPSRFHSLIVYGALAKYGGSRVAPEAMIRAVSEGGRLRAALERDQLPPIVFGNALA